MRERQIKVGPPPIHEHYNPDTDKAELCGRVVCPYGYVGIEVVKVVKTYKKVEAVEVK